MGKMKVSKAVARAMAKRKAKGGKPKKKTPKAETEAISIVEKPVKSFCKDCKSREKGYCSTLQSYIARKHEACEEFKKGV